MEPGLAAHGLVPRPGRRQVDLRRCHCRLALPTTDPLRSTSRHREAAWTRLPCSADAQKLNCPIWGINAAERECGSCCAAAPHGLGGRGERGERGTPGSALHPAERVPTLAAQPHQLHPRHPRAPRCPAARAARPGLCRGRSASDRPHSVVRHGARAAAGRASPHPARCARRIASTRPTRPALHLPRTRAPGRAQQWVDNATGVRTSIYGEEARYRLPPEFSIAHGMW